MCACVGAGVYCYSSFGYEVASSSTGAQRGAPASSFEVKSSMRCMARVACIYIYEYIHRKSDCVGVINRFACHIGNHIGNHHIIGGCVPLRHRIRSGR